MEEYIWLFMTVIVLLLALNWQRARSFYQRIGSLEDLQSSQSAVSGKWLRGKVVFVNEGDLFQFFHVPWVRSTVYNGEPTLRIRLAGIDAPETPQPFSYKAKEKLKELVLNEIVKVKLLGVDQYSRILAICYNTSLMGVFKTTNVNTKMVELGLASVYRGRDATYDDYEEDLLRLQEEAKKRKNGIWSQANYVSPSQYRRHLRERIERDRNESERNENQCPCM